MSTKIHAAPLALLCGLALTTGAEAQLQQQRSRGDDMRDTVQLHSGKTVRGRVLRRFDPNELVIVQGGKRKEFRHDKVAEVSTVRDHLREFFEARQGQDHDAADTHWHLCRWAHDRELYHLARVEAYATLARDPDHIDAHTYLEHKQRGNGTWRWRLDGRLVSKSRFDDRTGEIGSGLELRSEAFILQTNVDLRRATDALLDLERLHVFWLEEYGPKLELDEIVDPLPVKLFKSQDDFPALTSSYRRPYFLPNPHNEKSFLYFEEDADRPTGMFSTVTQHILYHSLARDADPGDPKARFCDWLEIGLGEWMESRCSGPAGLVEIGDAVMEPWVATATVEGRRYSLKNMLHLTLQDHFYTGGSIRRRTGRNRSETHWAAVQAFTTFLLDEEANPGTDRLVWEYLYTALRLGRGDSSSAFDKAFGRDIEEYEKPWQRWLDRHANPTTPK